jgi:hypothetical protein
MEKGLEWKGIIVIYGSILFWKPMRNSIEAM